MSGKVIHPQGSQSNSPSGFSRFTISLSSTSSMEMLSSEDSAKKRRPTSNGAEASWRIATRSDLAKSAIACGMPNSKTDDGVGSRTSEATASSSRSATSMIGSTALDLVALIKREGACVAGRTLAPFTDGPPNSITPGERVAGAGVGLLTVAVIVGEAT